MTACPTCKRHWRSKSAYELFLRQQAVLAELRGGVPAKHLGPVSTNPTRHEKHAAKSHKFVMQGEIAA